MTYESWMNESFFQNILTDFLQTDVEVQDIKIEPCGPENDGLMSTMLRVEVNYLAEYERKADTFVVKLPSTQKVALEKVGKQGYDVHNKELLFYELAAPGILKVLATINESQSLIPRTIATSRDLEVIVFEDLKARDFAIKDRLIGLNEADIRLTLKKLAKFHAASLIIHRIDPSAFQAFNAGFFCRNVKAFNFYFTSSLELVADEVSQWEGFESYGAKLRTLQGSFVELATRCFDVLPGDFCVLNHGDLWTNNLMFKLDKNGKTEEVILIDFQFCHWGSPVLDLMHLLYTSLQEEIFDQPHIEAFVEFFYCKLKSALERLDYDIESFPSLEEFQFDFTKKMFYGLVYTLAVLPVMTSDDPDNDFTAHHSNDERAINFKRRMLKDPRYQRIVKKLLPAFDQKGILDQVL